MTVLLCGKIMFWVGVAIMAVTVIAALIAVIVFMITGQRIKDNLRREYGEPWN